MMRLHLWVAAGIVALLLAGCAGTSSTPAPTNTMPPRRDTVAPMPPAAQPSESPPTAVVLPAVTALSPTSTPSSATPAPSPTAEATPTPTATTAPPWPPRVRVQPWLQAPAPITHARAAPDGSERLFVVLKDGRILEVQEEQWRATPFLDIRDRVDSQASERGLLSMAWGPAGRLYVYYTSREGNGDAVISRFTLAAGGQTAIAASEELLLRIDEPAANHNGGQVQFGPDGMLYIGTGDGGQAGDPWDNAENLQSLLGKLLRIDVHGAQSYRIPGDNPFRRQNDARPEIWAYGLRNPWRFSFDALTGDLYIADVGQNRWEEIDFVPAGRGGGQHFGWDTMEAEYCYEPQSDCDASGKVLPVFSYGHDQGCSVTGGQVYRGQRYPHWWGLYFFADFCSGQVWALHQSAPGQWQAAVVADSGINPASFAIAPDGELLLLGLNGEIMRLMEE